MSVGTDERVSLVRLGESRWERLRGPVRHPAGHTSTAGPPGRWRIDAHHHVWELAARPQRWLDAPELALLRRDFTLDQLTPHTAAAGIDRTIVVQVLADVEETREFLGLAASSPLVAGVVGWADLTSTDLINTLAELRAGAGGECLKGIRNLVQAEPDPDWLRRPDVLRGLRAVADAGLVYDLLTAPRQLPAAIECVRSLPELTFVLDHVSKPPIASGAIEPWASLIRTLAREPNVYCKLSGMVTEASWQSWTTEQLRPYAQVVFEAFGPGRIMFGSDWPVCLLAADYQQVCDAAAALTASLSSREQADVFGGNAIRVYGLSYGTT
jgi:L-fuconolactonase